MYQRGAARKSVYPETTICLIGAFLPPSAQENDNIMNSVTDHTRTDDRLRAMRVSKRARFWLRVFGLLVVLIVILLCCILRWGGHWLVRSDQLPPSADAAIVLEGSIQGEQARLAGAMSLLRQGRIPRVLLGLPKQSYWGEPLAPAASAYLQRTFGHDAGEVDFCEVDADSTAEEAAALLPCIGARGLHSIVIITSDYHTRRAGIIWRRVLRGHSPELQIWIHGIADPEYSAEGWWRRRLWAKTWFFELTKLMWTEFGGS